MMFCREALAYVGTLHNLARYLTGMVRMRRTCAGRAVS